MAQKNDFKIDLTWLVYLAYIVLIGCSIGSLPMGLFSPAKWVLTALLAFLNLFLVLGVGMMFLALKKVRESQNITMTVNSKEQKKWSWVLLAEIAVVYFLVKGPQGEQLTFLASLVGTKVVLTVIFMICHFRLRKYLPTKIE
jgi:hypothetical protein